LAASVVPVEAVSRAAERKVAVTKRGREGCLMESILFVFRAGVLPKVF